MLHLWWKENLVKHQKVSKYYAIDCSYTSAKTLEHKGKISSSSFCGQLADYYFYTFLTLSTHCYWMSSPSRKWERGGQSKNLPCSLCVSCKSRELGGRGSPRFPTPVVESFSVDLLPTIKSYWAESHLELFIFFRLNPGVRGEHFTTLLSWIAAWLFLIVRVWPIYLAHELVLGVL